MFDINKILGNKKSKNISFTDMNLSNTFGKNPFSKIVGNLTNKPLKKMGASNFMQNKWKNMNSIQRNKARKKYKDSDGDRIPDIFDCSPFNVMRQDINFGRKPNNMLVDEWNKQKDILNKSTLKTNTELDPKIRMNTILHYDKGLKRLNNIKIKTHDWHKKYNKEAFTALKQQGYNDDDIIGFLAHKNKVKVDSAAYFAQELAKDKKIGHLFKGAIPDIPMSDEEGYERYKSLKDESQFISGFTSVADIKKQPKKLLSEQKQNYEKFWGFNYDEPKEKTTNKSYGSMWNDLANDETAFEFEQEKEAKKHLKKLQQIPYNKLSYDEREFVDAMSTKQMNNKDEKKYFEKRTKDLSSENIGDRYENYEYIENKEKEGKTLTKPEKEFKKYNDLMDEDYNYLTNDQKGFIKEYRFKEGYDEDIIEDEDDGVDTEKEFYKWRDNKK